MKAIHVMMAFSLLAAWALPAAADGLASSTGGETTPRMDEGAPTGESCPWFTSDFPPDINCECFPLC